MCPRRHFQSKLPTFQQDLAPCKMQGRLSSVENKGAFFSVLSSASGTSNPSIDLKKLLAYLGSHSEGTQLTLVRCTHSLCSVNTLESCVPQEVPKPPTLWAATGLGGTFLCARPCWSICFWPWPNRVVWETDPALWLWCSHTWLTQVLDWMQITKYLVTVAPLFPFGSWSFAVISLLLTSQLCIGSVRSSLSFTNLCLEICFLRNDMGTYRKQLTSVLRIFSCRWNYYSSVVL